MDLPRWLFWTVAILLVTDRLVYMLGAAPLPDEGYYWLWAQHPALSYYDHPPLQAWVLSLSGKVFGHSILALRVPTLFSTAAVIWSIGWWVRRVNAAGIALPVRTAVLVVFASPMIFVLSEIVFHDHLLIALLSLATIPSALVLERFLQSGIVSRRHLYWAAVLIGLAGLTKYNAVLFPLGLFAAILMQRQLRGLLRSPHLYLAALVMLAIVAPVFIWNHANGDSSFQYNLSDRLSNAPFNPVVWAYRLLVFLVASVLVVGPVLVAIARFTFRQIPAPLWFTAWRRVAFWVLVVTTLFVLGLSAYSMVNTYWAIVAYAPLLPFLALYFQRRWHMITHLLYGTLIITLTTFNFAVMPVFAVLGTSGHLSGLGYGWSEIVAKVTDWQSRNAADFVATSDYRSGSILAFTRNDPDVEVFSTRTSQFTLWRDETARAGQSAIILTEPKYPMVPVIANRFQSVMQLESFPVKVFGYEVAHYSLYLGQGYRPEARP